MELGAVWFGLGFEFACFGVGVMGFFLVALDLAGFAVHGVVFDFEGVVAEGVFFVDEVGVLVVVVLDVLDGFS